MCWVQEALWIFNHLLKLPGGNPTKKLFSLSDFQLKNHPCRLLSSPKTIPTPPQVFSYHLTNPSSHFKPTALLPHLAIAVGRDDNVLFGLQEAHVATHEILTFDEVRKLVNHLRRARLGIFGKEKICLWLSSFVCFF